MKFWCLKFSKKTTKKIDKILPKNLKSGQINKIKALTRYSIFFISFYFFMWYILSTVFKTILKRQNLSSLVHKLLKNPNFKIVHNLNSISDRTLNKYNIHNHHLKYNYILNPILQIPWYVLGAVLLWTTQSLTCSSKCQ